LAGGILTGKYLEGAPHGEKGRLSSEETAAFRKDKADEDRIARAVVGVARKLGVSAAQVALAWLRYASVPVIPIVGAKKLTQLEDNLASAQVELSAADLDTLNEASAITPGFPNNFYEKPMVRTFVYGGLRDRIKA
jgi:aryl-alcohol dehydrogenase-like predicted oxidoreductase